MTDNPAPASLRSLGSDDAEPHDAGGSIPLGQRWVDHITVTAEGDVLISAEGVDLLEHDRQTIVQDTSRAVANDGSGLRLGKLARRRSSPDGWGYSCTWQEPSHDGSRLYTTPIAAARACAIQLLAGTRARCAYDRSQRLPVPTEGPHLTGLTPPEGA